jgi:alkylhydroperoxidase family enzyme
MGDGPVEAVLADLATAPIPEPLRKTLAFLKKVTREHEQVTAADVKVLLAAGVSKQQVKDALNVAWCFNVITRLADTFQFEVGPRSAFEVGAKMLLTRGYR